MDASYEADLPPLGRINEDVLGRDPKLHTWVVGALVIARYHGVDLDPTTFRLDPMIPVPSPASLVEWIREQGLWAKAVQITWSKLIQLETSGPVMLLMKDGGSVLMVDADPVKNRIFVKEPTIEGSGLAVPIDELRLSNVWQGEVLLIRPERGEVQADAPLTFQFLVKLVLMERSILRSIAVATLVITFLSVAPMLIVYRAVQSILENNSMSTLLLVSIILVILVFYDALIEHARGNLLQVVSARIDAKIQLFIFKRLVSLPLDYFERTQIGVIGSAMSKINNIREFLTGKLLTTLIDGTMLIVLLPIMFYLSATLSWTIVGAAGLIMLIIGFYLGPLKRLSVKLAAAESRKFSILIETLHGIKTVKSLGLESVRIREWDENVAETGELRLRAGRLGLWPNTLTIPMQRYCQYGVLLLGAYLALITKNHAEIAGLMTFTMVARRAVQPLVSFTTLMQDFETANSTMREVQAIINVPPEIRGIDRGLRPAFAGAIEFDGVTFTYNGALRPALDNVNFAVPAGTMLGLVGRSGSGKSTVTRLLQGVGRDYMGFVKIDGIELRAINLRHLRRSFGVVLQENFLFRGSVRDNIIGGRLGLTMEDVVRAARLAGAEEFIERMPMGYDTFVQEGSPNLSGGQRQRLAIARAIITDPRLLILDEATSALDPESEALVNANLKRIGAGRTMVIVSHRLSSLVDCHAIIVMDRGTVLDVGTHHELVERCPVYRMLWLQQNRHLAGAQESLRNGAPMPVLVQGD